MVLQLPDGPREDPSLVHRNGRRRDHLRMPLKRHVGLKRTKGFTRKTRVGAAAQKRVRSGGVLAKGRESASKEEWREIVAAVRRRAGERCEILRSLVGTDPAHILSRSPRGWRGGGKDATWNVLWLSRYAHTLQDRPFIQGRLVYEFVECSMRSCCHGQEIPNHVRWRVERRLRKNAPLIEVIETGVVDLAVPPVNGPARL